MDDLFSNTPVERQLSPYAEWERHSRIKTHNAPNQMVMEPWTASQTIKSCGHSVAVNGDQYSAFGMTRDAAISNLCRKLGIALYGDPRTKKERLEEMYLERDGYRKKGTTT